MKTPKPGRSSAVADKGAAKAARGAAADPLASLRDVLRPGQSIALLQQLHILTRDGRLNQDTRRKLKQVLHLAQFIEKLIDDLPGAPPQTTPGAPPGLTLADHGAGKSYLGFILYDLIWRPRAAAGDMRFARGVLYGIETRPELVARSTELAARLGFGGMRFLNLAAADAAHHDALPPRIDLVTALHACDSATDDAIAFALAKQARALALVPCCQAELARALNAGKALNLARTPLAELWRHPLHTREMGSQLTNVLRCLYLQSQGYRVTVTELVGWEHSLKNELILATRDGQRQRSAAERLRALLAQFGVQDWGRTRFPLAFANVDANASASAWAGPGRAGPGYRPDWLNQIHISIAFIHISPQSPRCRMSRPIGRRCHWGKPGMTANRRPVRHAARRGGVKMVPSTGWRARLADLATDGAAPPAR